MKDVLEKDLRPVADGLLVIDKLPSAENGLRRKIRELKSIILALKNRRDRTLKLDDENEKLRIAHEADQRKIAELEQYIEVLSEVCVY